MVPFRLLFLPLTAAVCLAAGGCQTRDAAPSVDRSALRAAWTAWTAERDTLFRSAGSPLPESERSAFAGLPYFPYDSTLAVAAALVPAVSTDTVSFPTSTGELRPMVRAGQLVFTAGGVERRLVAYTQIEPGPGAGELFVPFRDETSGRETYGGGRYLDLPVAPLGTYALDFNRAYHPYCVYSDAYSCPLPPAENTLALPVEAGERLRAGA
ncbi:MAG TPA: DUF1684 domain-containing protein [Rubricoccaceae bacterium]